MRSLTLGDLDGDGHTELAVGASGDDTNGSGRGAVHVLFLNANGTVKNIRKIASGTNGGPVLSDDDAFGRAVASVGDLDGDGVTDLAVGAYRDDTGGGGRGAVHVLLLNSDGTVKSSQKIASGIGGGPTLANDDRFGSSVASLGDLDGDGRIELAVGAETDDTGGDSRGAVHVLFLTGREHGPGVHFTGFCQRSGEHDQRADRHGDRRQCAAADGHVLDRRWRGPVEVFASPAAALCRSSRRPTSRRRPTPTATTFT